MVCCLLGYRLRVEVGASAPSGPPKGEQKRKQRTLAREGNHWCSRTGAKYQFGSPVSRLPGKSWPTTKSFSALSRVSFIVKFLYCISTPTFSRSFGKRIGMSALWRSPIPGRGRLRSPARRTRLRPIQHAHRNPAPEAGGARTRRVFPGGPPSSSSPPSPAGGIPSSWRIGPVPNLYSAKIVGFSGILFQSASA